MHARGRGQCGSARSATWAPHGEIFARDVQYTVHASDPSSVGPALKRADNFCRDRFTLLRNAHAVPTRVYARVTQCRVVWRGGIIGLEGPVCLCMYVWEVGDCGKLARTVLARLSPQEEQRGSDAYLCFI